MPNINPQQQRAFALDVVRKLRDQGFTALWAGGCVRDQLLAGAPKDYDVATDATPPQVRDVFGRRRTLEIGAAFGVIVVLGPREAGQIDVATFRQEGGYSDGRRPDHVSFTSPELDAQRRDFTINGLFFDPLEERVIDYVGGLDDLQRGIVRAIGVVDDRFDEDKLRMLRAVRFAARFVFALDDATLAAIRQRAEQIHAVSAERIAAEMTAMLVDSHRAKAIELLRESRLLAAVLPEVDALAERSASEPAISAWKRTLATLGNLALLGGDVDRGGTPPLPFPLALAALLQAIGSVDTVAQVARRWRLSNDDETRAAWLVEQLPEFGSFDEWPWPRQQRLLISPGIGDLLALYQAAATAIGNDLRPLQLAQAKLELPPHELNPAPLLTGSDLIAHGVPRGPIYAQLLRQVRDAQLEKTIADRPAALALVDRLLADS